MSALQFGPISVVETPIPAPCVFTLADVDALERIAHAHRLNRFAADEDVLGMMRIRDRIAALLPPTPQ